MDIPIVGGLIDRITGKPSGREIEDINVPMEPPSPKQLFESQPPEFRDEFYRMQERNLQVDSKESLINLVESSHLSQRCKRAWLTVTNAYFDRNILLSDLTGKNVRQGWSSDEQVLMANWYAAAEIMGTVYVASYKSDRRRPEFVQIERMLLAQIRYRLRRTMGPDRAAMIQGRIQFNYTGKQTVEPVKKG